MALCMAPLLLIALIGLSVDTRLITGATAWLKPAKFAFSTGLYGLTLAWMFGYLAEWPCVRAVAGWISGAVLVPEVLIIFVQAARGTTSHFNIATPLDAALFLSMGTGILLVWGAAIVVTVALFRQKFSDPALGWALRLGMLITVIGAATGGLMTTPTHAQLAEARATHHMPVVGAHTVGAPDGGPGLPITGWSRDHGDLRVPHFVGLHAMQILPLLALLWRPKRAGAMIAAGGAYLLVFALTLIQALAGQSLLGGLL